jgi:hypothetical protein
LSLRHQLLTTALTLIMVGAVSAVSVGFSDGSRADLPRPDPPTPVQAAVAAGPPAPAPAPSPSPSPTPEPRRPGLDLTADVSVKIDGFLSWAALDLRTGERAGSKNQRRTTTTESMIKVWLAADYLRRHSGDGQKPGKAWLAEARRAIRISHNGAAERLYQAGGSDAVVDRMIKRCGLRDTKAYPYYWSRTRISARDAVQLGVCLADGTAAGKRYTDWLLRQMREVKGSTRASDQPMPGGGEGGYWGIVDGLPPEVLDGSVAIKNGWTALSRTGNWHVNCLAITEDWVMAVLMQYPAARSLGYGARRCASVAEQLVVPATPAWYGLE